MISLDLARKLKLKLNRQNQVKVSGLWGIPTQITASAEIKITLGSRVVYIMESWVANIGEGLDVLLGMDLMFRAGVRVCVREGLVQLPDEESILMYDENVKVLQSVDLPVTSPENLYLMPQYGHTNPDQEVVWAGRSDRWVTKIVYQARSWSVAIKVVNVSKHNVCIDMRTPLARIVQYGLFPQAGRFVSPGTRAYREWQTLILEHAQSQQDRLSAERREQALRDREPPCVPKMEYQWPTQIMLRPQPGSAEVRMAQLQAPQAGTQTEEDSPVTTRMDVATQSSESQLDNPGCDPGDSDTLEGDRGDTFVDTPPEWTTKFEEPQGDETSAEIHPGQDTSGFPPGPASCTPLERFEMEYERCMRVSAEDLDLDPGVYNEGSEKLAQLRDQLVMLPECDIDQADVGVPGETSPEEESRMRAILKRHRKIFLGDGNAAPAPARGVVCHLHIGDAKSIALRPIGPHVAVKVYELLKKLLENNLIEHSESQWASPIVIVLKKVDIRMCIDYRLVNNFIQLSSYPLPLTDDLLVGFEKVLWFMNLDMASGFWTIKMTERTKLISAFVCPFGHFQWIRMPFDLKNAPLIYHDQQLPVGIQEEAEVDQEVLDYLNLDPQDDGPPGCGTPGCTGCEDGHISRSLPTLADQMTVFKRNIPAPTQMSPVLGRSSYIDDIAHDAPTWNALCADLDAVLYRLRYWNISESRPKSEFGKLSIPYLSHEISAEGIKGDTEDRQGSSGFTIPDYYEGSTIFLGQPELLS
ncbi:LOW QUALITY PROTEIN: hypothetical protein PHMEG_00011518 [Phytophthora megakarya]|uniref:Reverse transcriptase domain-containing protein n=1 Tax=Phytophthora megakarya TaxID=4795 RepID=A0A225WBH7_9STRA|nr:LOW QUALITY PROTEIN: hypothetical protein PHMEG_00011518 [Phytophthora megakarya]